ncbi:MAG: hypothetical protein HFI45_05345 [Lachnospiraceae bacterium]|nr:hypothetical protein [Lachnospiraceae bacterium]
MRKSIIKSTIVVIVFFAALFIIGNVMNKGNADMTTEMEAATYPVVSVNYGGFQINKMHGYRDVMEVDQMRECITPLAAGRKMQLTIDTYGNRIGGLRFEVRSVDGSRLIENTEMEGYEQSGDEIRVSFGIKDLIENNQEYLFVLVLTTGAGKEIRYYTRIVNPEEYYVADKLEYVRDFSNKTFDKEAAKSLTKYLESNAEGDNTTFGRVTIHSSFHQVTWGDLDITRISNPEITIKDLGAETGNFVMEYYVSMPYGSETNYYRVKEYYRIRHTADRIYLLDYERTMNQIFNEKGNAYANNKILLGIVGEEPILRESDGGNAAVFVSGNRLFSYNIVDNKLALLFGFYDGENMDARTLYDGHKIKILNVDEGGNVIFLVYGYMNRGRHEGQVGISVYYYDSTVNTVEEMAYIPCSHSQAILMKEVDQLSYINRNGKLYLLWDDQIYAVDVVKHSSEIVVENLTEENFKVSDSNRMVVWQNRAGTGKDEETAAYEELILMNLISGAQKTIQAGTRERIIPIGFMGEDLIYGIAREDDIQKDYAGNEVIPMYLVRIANESSGVLMEYRQENVYVLSGTVEGNQIILKRLQKTEDGTFTEIADDQIMNAESAQESKNTIEVAAVDKYEKLTQIALKSKIDVSTLLHLTPKEVLFEGGRNISLPEVSVPLDRYYVYGKYGIETVCTNEGRAVKLADGISGTVTAQDGSYIWQKGNRSLRNQIMAIQGESISEGRDSLAVCLDTILAYEGVVRNSQYMLRRGDSVLDILKESLEDARVLDLTGCTLDAVLYYVNRDIPVLAMMQDGTAVLIVGFNEKNTVVMNPEIGNVYKVGMNDSTEWFEQNGNHFITYIRDTK